MRLPNSLSKFELDVRARANNEKALVNGVNVTVECKGGKRRATILVDK
ncbi:hypothetical protein VCRA2119O48_110037 [Vibrio crassostreae]|nr:hypothetical protein VCRA2119O48_110037 [Vibrio crassostreae]CAK3923212.1 hypothetical protein VCRA212O16_380036 [Vibrio crassostreae]